MKKSFFIPFLFLIAIGILFSCNHKSDQPKIKISATFGGHYYKGDDEYAFIVGKIHNTSSDTLLLFSMSCSWDDFWQISSKNIKLEKNLCYMNGPAYIRLPPNGSMLNYLPVKLLKPYKEIQDEKFRVGYNVVKLKTTDDLKDWVKKLEEKNFYWSDTLQLNQLNRFNTFKIEK